jgi:predicted kinase
MVQLLVITGSMGAGKSAVLAEASDILKLRDIAHAAIDVDSLFLGHVPSVANNDDLMYANLRSVCRNYAAMGAQRFILARALETRAQLELCREITSATATTVCRLTASLETLRHRVKARESGVLQQEFVARVAELKSILDRARLEHFTVTNEDRPLNEVALEVLLKAGWIAN